jgi:hypothetical protein
LLAIVFLPLFVPLWEGVYGKNLYQAFPILWANLGCRIFLFVPVHRCLRAVGSYRCRLQYEKVHPGCHAHLGTGDIPDAGQAAED